MAGVAITRISQEVRTDESGAGHNWVRVEYMVGDDGPFEYHQPEDTFDPPSAEAYIREKAMAFEALRGAFER